MPVRAAAADIRPVAPFIDEQTVAVLYTDLGRLDLPAFFRALEKAEGADAKDLADFKKESQRLVGKLKEGGARSVYLLFSLAHLPEDPPVVVIPLAEGKDAKELAKALSKEEWLAPR